MAFARPTSCALLFALLTAVLLAPGKTVHAQEVAPEPWPEGEPAPVQGLDGARWYRGELGWIAVRKSRDAVRAAGEMRAAAEAWERHFEREAPSGAVIDARYSDRSEEIEAAGADWVLAYPFDQVAERARQGEAEPDGAGDGRVAAIRSQIEARLEEQGLRKSEEEIDAMVEQALAKMEDAGAGQGSSPDIRKALRHEIGHDLFVARWPSRGEGNGRYGSGAPDWLDETAAVLMEGPRHTEARRKGFLETVDEGKTIPLAEFFTMEHPLYGSEQLRALRQSAREEGKGGRSVVLSGEEAHGMIDQGKHFYVQTRGLIDFLLERSGQPDLFTHVARALRSGSSLEAWLRERGPEHGLPPGVAALEEAFLEWARSDPYDGS